jgi:2'-5' RNA ligase
MASDNKLYFLALIPPDDVERQIRQFKIEMRENFDAKHALKLPAHITLQPPFWMFEEKEPELLEALEQFATQETKFQVQLEGFGCFSPHVIFVKVKNYDPVLALHGNLLAALKEIIQKEKNPPIHPHLTIASRDLKKHMFEPAWKDFRNRSFVAEFQAKSIFLLKHNGKTWDVLKEQPF